MDCFAVQNQVIRLRHKDCMWHRVWDSERVGDLAGKSLQRIDLMVWCCEMIQGKSGYLQLQKLSNGENLSCPNVQSKDDNSLMPAKFPGAVMRLLYSRFDEMGLSPSDAS